MKIHRDITRRALVTISVIILVSGFLLYISLSVIAHILDNVAKGTELRTKDAVIAMFLETQKVVDSLSASGASFDGDSALVSTDSSLSDRFTNILIKYDNIAGGLFLASGKSISVINFSNKNNDTSRIDLLYEYNEVIKTENKSVIDSGRVAFKMNEEVDAIFDLSAIPLKSNNKVIGSVWCIMRAEQIFPLRTLNYLLALFGFISIGGIVFAVIVSYVLRLRVEEVQFGLNELKMNQDFRLRRRGGILGSIVDSINETAEIRTLNEKEREKLSSDLRQKEKLAALGKLLAGVAHEIKTPLAIMKTRIQIWQRKLKNPEKVMEVITPDSMELVVNEIDRLSDLVKKLLAFSKAKNKNLMPVDLTLVIEQVEELMQNKFEENNVIFKKIIEPDIPRVLSDPQGLEQVFINLFSNSIEAMMEGGELIVSVGRNSVKDGVVNISVADTGTGITNDIAELIFDPFFTTRDQGTGLGLSIAFEVISASKGKIYLKDKTDIGTEFVIELKIYEKSS
jgi:signal transduction histidine kinase